MIKKNYLFLIVLPVCIILASKSTSAQTASGDSTGQQWPLNNAVKLFYTSLGKQSPLFNGKEYSPPYLSIKGNALFLDANTFTPGDVVYDGLFFTGVPMKFDIHNEQLVILLYNKFSELVLLQSRVKYFDYLAHHFINLNADSINNKAVIKAGYYDEIYSGRTKVLVKRSKKIQTEAGQSYFETDWDIFIRKNNTYYNTSSQGALLDVLKDKKTDIQQYIKANKIKFRKDPEAAMIKIVSFYDHLNN